MTKTCPDCHATVLSTSQPERMDDLVDLLRMWPASYDNGDVFSSTYVGKLMRQAAGEIERLAALAATPASSGTQGALALYLNEVQPDVDGRVQLINISLNELSVLRRLVAAMPAVGGEAAELRLANTFNEAQLKRANDEIKRLRDAAQPDAPLRGREAIAKAAQVVVDRVNNYDDRTSPEDWPDALLITSEELHSELMRFAEDISVLTPEQPAAAPGTERKTK